MSNNTNTPWCEKYRPNTIDSIVLEPNNREIFKNIIDKKHFPHLLFYGPPGVGKTTSAENLIKNYQMIHSRYNKENIIHLNASDERGIEVIRNQIYQFAKSSNMFEKGFKFIILDEVDYMTKNAQQALKNILQSCTSNVKFCLICNYICKIEDSLRNEFICIRFNQLPKDEIFSLIKRITVQECLNIDDKTITMIQNMYSYDIRSMLNFLQLHQENSEWKRFLFHDGLWETLHDLFVNVSMENKDSAEIDLWLKEVALEYFNVETKTCLKRFFNFIICYKKELVNKEFLNMCETLLHVTSNEYMIPYFIEQMKLQYIKLKNNI